jgi:hypothetical protein
VCVNTRDKSRVEEEDDDDDIMMTMICVPSIHPFSIHSLVSVQSKRKHKVLVNLAGWMDGQDFKRVEYEDAIADRNPINV